MATTSTSSAQSSAPPQQTGRPKMTKAERRALQERQRAQKAAARADKAAHGEKKKQQQQQQQQQRRSQHGPASSASPITSETTGAPLSRGKHARSGSDGGGVSRLYAHLQQQSSESQQQQQAVVHPAMLQLAVKYRTGRIMGGTARTVSLLQGLRCVVEDYEGPPNDRRISHDLDARIKPMIDHITSRRPLSVGMGNALKHFKLCVHRLSHGPEPSVGEAKAHLLHEIDKYIEERVSFTMSQIVKLGAKRVVDGDVVMVYARSQVVQEVLLEAHRRGTRFSVVVVAAAKPGRHSEGPALLRTLAAHGVPCTYTLLTGASHMMNKGATKVMLGAHAMLSNGTLMARVGTACIAMLAHRYNVPVLVCCETFKFSDRSQLDSITRNELADPAEIISNSSSGIRPTTSTQQQQQQQQEQRTVTTALNLVYDITPSRFIDTIITEVGQLPPTSVIHVLREYGNPLMVAD